MFIREDSRSTEFALAIPRIGIKGQVLQKDRLGLQIRMPFHTVLVGKDYWTLCR